MVFNVRSIRVFSNFLDPYYEPLLWFMIFVVSIHDICCLYSSSNATVTVDVAFCV